MAAIERTPGARRRAQIRFLLAALVLAVLYTEISEAWLWMSSRLMYIGWYYDDPASGYAEQAVQLANESRARESTLSALHPAAAFELGLFYGYVNDSIAQMASHPLTRPLDSRFADMQIVAKFLGVGSVGLMPMSEANQLLPQLLEQDAGGVAARVEKATSARLRHLYLLGAQAGVELSRLELPGDLIWPPSGSLIGIHGTLAGLPERQWRPLTRVWPPNQFLGRDRPTALANYGAAVKGVMAYLHDPLSASSESSVAPK